MENNINVDEEIVVDASSDENVTPEPFKPEEVDFENLTDEGKVEAWKKLIEQHNMLMTIANSFQTLVKQLEEKAQGKVSDDSYKRLMADYDNYKRRTATARSEGFIDGQMEVVKEVVDILDNFERGLSMIADQSLKAGFDMIHKTFVEKLQKVGVEEIEAMDKEFDPNLMNAVMQGEEEGKAPDTVLEVFQKGYTLKGKVVRHSFVKVCK